MKNRNLNYPAHLIVSLIFLFGFIPKNKAQVYTNKPVGKKNTEFVDSLKNTEYPFVLPIWGAKAVKKGFDLPYSVGLSINSLFQTSELVLDNLQVGFNNKEKIDLDGIVRFNKAEATTSSVSFRPDFWLFPFLNVYAILGISQASTKVGYSVWIPDSSDVEKELFSDETEVKFNAQTYGFGITPTMGVGGFFLAFDMNFAWTDVPQLSQPAFSFVFDPRIGKNLKFKKRDRSVALWVGGFRFNIRSGTEGSVNLSDVIEPTGEFQNKIDDANQNINESQSQVNDWWNSLSSIEQSRPSNIAKYNAANAALEKSGQLVAGMEQAASNINNSSVQYSMDKRPKDMWNFIVGGQFQYNKHWMVRFEYGFLGSRTQILAGLQYRFGI
ncbi:MAG: hypothetical protein MUF75_11525 [Bacteroidia bacterium]|jgi:hypothetical protein|nr:hypothetical protein [Bacteroidia bacterium]